MQLQAPSVEFRLCLVLNNPSKSLGGRDVLGFQADARGRQLGNVCSRTGVARFPPDSGGFDLVFGFAFFVEVAAVDVVYDRHGEVLHLQTAKGFSTKLFVGYHLRLLDAL